MKKQFNHIVVIKGTDRVFPIDNKSYVLFFTLEEKRRFFIYALYTKKDLSGSELIELDFDSYMSLRTADVIENVVENIDQLGIILLKMKRQILSDNTTVGELLKLK